MHYMPSDIQGRAHTQSAFSAALYAILLVVLALRFVYGLFDYEPLGVLVSAVSLVAFSALCLWVTRASASSGLMRFMLALQPMLSIMGVTAIVHYSGGLHSNFIFLYSIPVLASVWVSSTFAIMTALGAVLFLGGLLTAEMSGYLPAVAKTGYEASQLVAIHMSRLILLLAIVLTASLTYVAYVSRKHQTYADLQDQTLYHLAQELPAPLAQSILSRLDPHVSISKNRNTTLGVSCASCSMHIALGEDYWGISDSSQVGEYRNDIHCVSCHTQEDCAVCGAYGLVLSAREALS